MNNFLRDVGEEILNSFRNNVKEKENVAFYKGLDIGFVNAINCMLDLGIDQKLINAKIVEYWNLRPSDVNIIIEREKYLMDNNKERKYCL